MEIKFLGQAGFLITDNTTSFMIDPYLSNYVVTSGIGEVEYFSRAFPIPLNPHDLRGINLIFVTHDHADHTDPDTLLPILKNNPQCVVIGPLPSLEHLKLAGVGEEQTQLAQVFKPEVFGDLHYTALPSAHYELEKNEISGDYPYLGYVIEVGGKVFYHAGDTIMYDGLVENLKKISDHYDICCLPVNGRDARREAMGMIGNLHPEESLELAQQLNARLLIPMHNDLFAINSLDPQRLNLYAKEHYSAQKIKWMKPGEVLFL